MGKIFWHIATLKAAHHGTFHLYWGSFALFFMTKINKIVKLSYRITSANKNSQSFLGKPMEVHWKNFKTNEK